MKTQTSVYLGISAAVLLSSIVRSQEVQSTILSDKIRQGDGVIDLLKEIEGNTLATYFNQTGGLLLLGADLNEDASGNEGNSSVGVAIKTAQLSITTTAGDFTFTDFFTSTTSMLRESGAANTGQYYTMFGQGGSSQITGTGPVDISRFDDVMWFENISFQGQITSALLKVSLLNTPGSRRTDAESFFDFSGGFEEFALFSAADAVLLEEAGIGMQQAPSGLNYASTESASSAIKEALAGIPADPEAPAPDVESTPVSTPPAAPSPPLAALASMAALLVWKKRAALKNARS